MALMTLRQRLLALAGAAVGLPLSGCSAPPAPTAHRGTPAPTSPLHPLLAADEATTTVPPTTTTKPVAAAVVTIEGIPAPTASGTTTTTFAVPGAETEESDEEWWAGQPGYETPARDAILACIRSYEQNDNPLKGPTGYASDTGNGYYGAYQFDLSTWRSVGGAGNPAHASPAEQDARAWALYLDRGLSPWPTPNSRCR